MIHPLFLCGLDLVTCFQVVVEGGDFTVEKPDKHLLIGMIKVNITRDELHGYHGPSDMM